MIWTGFIAVLGSFDGKAGWGWVFAALLVLAGIVTYAVGRRRDYSR